MISNLCPECGGKMRVGIMCSWDIETGQHESCEMVGECEVCEKTFPAMRFVRETEK